MIQATNPDHDDARQGQRRFVETPQEDDSIALANRELYRDLCGRELAEKQNSSWLWLPVERSGSPTKYPARATPCANIYIADELSAVVASKGHSIYDHGTLSSALREHLERNPTRAPGVNLDTLCDYQVSGFVDGPNVLIRIECCQTYFANIKKALSEGEGVEAARHALFQQVARYRRAIDVALKATEESGGEVLLLAEGMSPQDEDARLKVAKILGEVHRVQAQQVSTRAKFVGDHITETPWGRYYYRKEQGTRYISVQHLAALREHVSTSRATFVAGITTVSDWLWTRNKQGAREAVLLLIDDTGSSLLADSRVERDLKEKLRAIATLAGATPERSWSAKAPQIETLLDEAVKIFQAATHQDFRRDDLQNPRYVEVVANILRGYTGNVPLGTGFSTPLKAVDVGHFVSGALGQKTFQITTTGPVQREIVNWVLSNEKLMGSEADWLCLFEPQIALTPDYHPALVSRSLLPQTERNFIVLAGVAGGEECRVVIRENQCSASHLNQVDSDRLVGIKSLFSPEQLADAYVATIDAQFRLLNGLYCSLEQGMKASTPDSILLLAGASLSVPPFEPIQVSPERRLGDFFKRQLIDGERLDRLSKFEMSREQMEYALEWIGKLMAVNFLAQRPAFPLHELLSVSEEKEGGYIRSIGASNSFCNAINVRDVSEALEKGAILYGTHLASWIMSLRLGAYGESLPVSDEVDRCLISSCLSSFKRAYDQIVEHAQTQFIPIAYQTMQPGKTPPRLLNEVPQWDIGRNVPLTMKLLKLDTSERAAFLRSVQAVTLQMCDCIGRVCAEPWRGEALAAEEVFRLRKEREQLIDRVYSLVGNHLSADSFGPTKEVLSGRAIDFSRYSLEERCWLLTVIDVELWLTEVHDDAERGPLWCTASDSVTERRFVDVVREEFWHACFSEKRTKDFYQAVHGLERVFTNDPERRSMLEGDLLKACGFKPLWEEPATQ